MLTEIILFGVPAIVGFIAMFFFFHVLYRAGLKFKSGAWFFVVELTLLLCSVIGYFFSFFAANFIEFERLTDASVLGSGISLSILLVAFLLFKLGSKK